MYPHRRRRQGPGGKSWEGEPVRARPIGTPGKTGTKGRRLSPARFAAAPNRFAAASRVIHPLPSRSAGGRNRPVRGKSRAAAPPVTPPRTAPPGLFCPDGVG
jgi:hypothetical protein